MKRRRTLIVAGVAGAAALAGSGVSLWRTRSRPPADDGGLWAMSFTGLDGGSLDMAAWRGRPLVLNFWASWCAPCVKEMPEIDRFHGEFSARGWQVLGLAIDKPEAVRDFLARVPVGFPIALAGPQGMELLRRLGNMAGGLPYTVVFDRQGRPARTRLGETNYRQLAGWAAAIGN